MIADLGGGTLDFSAYSLTGVKPYVVEETAAAKCAFRLLVPMVLPVYSMCGLQVSWKDRRWLLPEQNRI